MKKLLLFLFFSYLMHNVTAESGQAYLERFSNYQQWSANLPQQPDSKFLAFIANNTPLANKLREKWLYLLAQQKDWALFRNYYQQSKDINLQCFAELANYNQGNQQQALKNAEILWLSGESRPPVCNQLFDLLQHNEQFNEQLITERIILALDKRNLPLARYLLKQYKQPRLADAQLLTAIYLEPKQINQLKPGPLHDYFYLYGLKRLVSINMDQALRFYQSDKAKNLLSTAQQQSFIAHVALYKAMRNHPDASYWFAQVKPAYYNEVLLDWQIRAALKQEDWKKVEQLIQQSTNKDNPCWQYWLARALEAQAQNEEATAIYHTLAKTRHYYGFLASMRLHKKPVLQNEYAVSDMALLKPYQPFTDSIKTLYNSKQTLQASRLLNDFVSELPKEDKSALIYWITHDLHWHSKSVYLSSTADLINQLSLRFPLAHHQTIRTLAKNYQIDPELVYAIIRQESGFRDEIASSAGARGLMQIMPATASSIAKAEKIPYAHKDQLFSSQKNINIGIAYLKQLAKRFDHHPVLMAAAYNAGPRRVNYWLKNHPPREIDIWIETLPWHETRNYLKNVIAFYAVYQYRLQQKADIHHFMRTFTQ